MFRLDCLLVVCIYAIPAGLAATPFVLAPSAPLRILAAACAPVVFAVSMVLVAGLLSLPWQAAIKPGRFTRDLSDPIYWRRRLYGTCWTQLYYCKPVYAFVLALPPLRWLAFRLFGYRGTLRFTIYPDSWIRDLPLLDIGEGAYIGNRSVLGTNMALMNGTTLVDRVSVGAGAMVGHLSALAAGAKLGDRSETGQCALMGIRSKMGVGSTLGHNAVLNHYSSVGDDSSVGTCGFLDLRGRVGDGLAVPAGFVVPPRARLKSEQDLQQLVSRKGENPTGLPPDPDQTEDNQGESSATAWKDHQSAIPSRNPERLTEPVE